MLLNANATVLGILFTTYVSIINYDDRTNTISHRSGKPLLTPKEEETQQNGAKDLNTLPRIQ